MNVGKLNNEGALMLGNGEQQEALVKGDVRMKLHSLLSYLPFAKCEKQDNPEILSIEQDTRTVKQGSLFICIKGSTYDGHLFAKLAVEKGAVAIIAEKPLEVTVPVVIVKDSNRAMAVLADAFYGHPSHKLYLIGVTGTNGKTSVTHILHHMFNLAGHRSGLIGSLYARIGDEMFETKNTTPDSLTLQKTYSKMVEAGAKIVSMEVSSHSLVNGRVLGSDFDLAIFTNLTQDHLDYHKNMEAYKQAKGLLFSRMSNHYEENKRRFAILNGDDSVSDYYRELTASHVLTYGIEHESDIQATNIVYRNDGTYFHLKTPIGDCALHIPLIGKFNVYNCLAAISAGLVYGLPFEVITMGVTTFQGVPGRFELVNENQPFPVIVDYAHTPDSLENVLKTASSMAKGRIFVVVGCGGDRDRTKRPLMAQIACQYATDPVFTSDNPRTEDPLEILKHMEEGVPGKQFKTIPDRKSAIDYVIQEAVGEDIILIAGKGHETYQIVGNQVLEFDDREIAREAIKKLYK